MNLSIFNSDKYGRKRSLNWLFVFSAAFVIMLIIMLCINYTFTSFTKVVDQERELQLTASKIFLPEKFDMVISGSSRMNFGLDPNSMSPILKNLRIYNCAMFGGAVNKEILDYLENRKIDWDNPGAKIVLVELSPRVLWKSLRKNRSYRSIIKKSPDEILRLLNYSPQKRFSVHNLLLPMDRERWSLRKNKKRSSIAICHPETGWYEVVNISCDTERKIQKRLANAQKTSVTTNQKDLYDIDDSLHELLAKTKEWSKRGVFVFGIEPPIDSRIRELEVRLSKYDTQKINKMFEESGGKVLKVSDNYKVVLDGSHLDSVEAKRFSAEIAEQISVIINAETRYSSKN